ncbi:GIY-YIG nuclease family protein [Crassaminicella thermophila]|uniref:GIY-YIG nuclease family protein n=1 Tax=Crassaminicella thermophila TaxID=2599308 RepID=A0A5C0SG28_CRATE|nr:GIY-YIG nuclease family protein [Crassaminicella thermophila]QEK12882.1 GIY-YIG nuclease family protein [Crassaminicella thermophila]
MYFAYMLRCSDNSLYSGYTKGTSPKKRVEIHNKGMGSKYTRARLPVKLVYFEEFKSKREAMKREYQFKKLNKAQKEKLVKEFNLLAKNYSVGELLI